MILLDPRKINPSQPLLLKAQCFCSYRRLAHRNMYKDTVDFHFVIVWNHWPSSVVLFRWNLDVNVTRASVAKIDPVIMFSFICWICWNNIPITQKKLQEKSNWRNPFYRFFSYWSENLEMNGILFKFSYLNPTSVRLLSYQLLYGGGIYQPPYKNLFKDQFDPIFCIGRSGGPKYHGKILKK